MTIVWMTFAMTALILALGALAAIRVKGELAPVYNIVGRLLLFMAIGTAVFPAFLRMIGVMVLVAEYVVFVISLTTIIVFKAIRASHQVA